MTKLKPSDQPARYRVYFHFDGDQTLVSGWFHSHDAAVDAGQRFIERWNSRSGLLARIVRWEVLPEPLI